MLVLPFTIPPDAGGVFCSWTVTLEVLWPSPAPDTGAAGPNDGTAEAAA